MTLPESETHVGDLSVSRETLQRLHLLEEMIKKWNVAINLVSRTSVDGLWNRHILDSVQIYRLAPPVVRRWVDIGSGGGFPGLVIACIAKELDPPRQFVLVESDLRKAIFLRQAAQAMTLDVTVLSERIEVVSPLNANVLSARALAPLHLLCDYAFRHLAPNGRALYQKGSSYPAEIVEAQKRWRFVYTVQPSETDTKGVTLCLGVPSHA